METGTSNAAVTNFDGEFELTVGDGKTIEVSYMGYKNKTLAVQSGFMTIQLEPNTAELNEVLVVGYGKQSKKMLPEPLRNLKQQILNKV